jgi:fatty-acyl-CoA synthase
MVRNSRDYGQMNIGQMNISTAPAAAAQAPVNSKFARDAWLRALANTATIAERGETLPGVIERLGSRFGDASALIDLDTELSFRVLAERANQYARFAMGLGLRQGDAVALMMNNCTEYVAVWLGFTRVGVVVALVNSQLSGDALVHSIAIVNPRAVIVGADLAARVAAVRGRLPPHTQCFAHGITPENFAPLSAGIAALPGDPLAEAECAQPSLDATALYIYTSGTTGPSKAAKVSHYRLMQWSYWFAGMLDTTAQDRMFNCLPLYHSVGGVVATFAPLVNGAAVVIRPRFSASGFWRDVRAQRCTLFQYIGELCRYLVNSPHQAGESEHSLRVACGNGLRPEVWENFQNRFRIPRILEYYASTEGNFSLYNCEGQPGAIGRIPPFLASRLPVALLKFDVDAAQPLRNAEGRCERCANNEVGEAVGLIPEGAERGGRFEGYADSEASERKVLRNVFKEGDAWYRTGDLMRRDDRGFFYFVDRVGETYRWKGENVSTAEVLTALTAARGVLEGVVYGVQVPGADGRAGMAALVVNAEFDLAEFRQAAAQRLPGFSRPVFLRLITSLEATGTFKPRKQDLVAAGFDPSRISDPLFLDDARSQAYVPLDAALFASIAAGTTRI